MQAFAYRNVLFEKIMTYLAWTNDYLTGIEDIDFQHRRIVDLLNELHDATLQQKPSDARRILNELIAYKIEHFSFEENLLDKAGYPFSKEHRKSHQILLNQTERLRARAANGDYVANEALPLFRNWLIHHFTGEDADYVSYIKDSLNTPKDEADIPWHLKTLNRFRPK